MASSNSPKARFVWDENLNGVFLREVVFHKPYQFRSGTKENAGCWVKLCAKLTGDDNKVYGFVGNPKVFRDHFNLLVNPFLLSLKFTMINIKNYTALLERNEV